MALGSTRKRPPVRYKQLAASVPICESHIATCACSSLLEWTDGATQTVPTPRFSPADSVTDAVWPTPSWHGTSGCFSHLAPPCAHCWTSLTAVLARDQLVTQHRGAMEDLATLGLALISLDLATAELVDQTLNSVGEIDPVTHPIFGSSLFSVSDRSQTPQERYNALIRCDGGVRTQLILAHAPGRQRRLTAFGSGVSTGFCVCLFVGWFAHILFPPPPPHHAELPPSSQPRSRHNWALTLAHLSASSFLSTSSSGKWLFCRHSRP